jgi:hypothetical protein
MQTSELTGVALDWAVAKIEQEWTDEDRWYNTIGYVDTGDVDDEPYYPSTDWAQGGAIIERELIELGLFADQWRAVMHLDDGGIYQDGTTPLIAAMRCYVASKLGDEVEIPEELKVTA